MILFLDFFKVYSGYTQVVENLGDSDLPEGTKLIIASALKDAIEDVLYVNRMKLFSWYVLPIAVLFVKGNLWPRWASDYAPPVSPNGDGWVVKHAGIWMHVDRHFTPAQGEQPLSYDSQDYPGYAYYKFLGLSVRPRSYLGRLAWAFKHRGFTAKRRVRKQIGMVSELKLSLQDTRVLVSNSYYEVLMNNRTMLCRIPFFGRLYMVTQYHYGHLVSQQGLYLASSERYAAPVAVASFINFEFK